MPVPPRSMLSNERASGKRNRAEDDSGSDGVPTDCKRIKVEEDAPAPAPPGGSGGQVPQRLLDTVSRMSREDLVSIITRLIKDQNADAIRLVPEVPPNLNEVLQEIQSRVNGVSERGDRDADLEGYMKALDPVLEDARRRLDSGSIDGMFAYKIARAVTRAITQQNAPRIDNEEYFKKWYSDMDEMMAKALRLCTDGRNSDELWLLKQLKQMHYEQKQLTSSGFTVGYPLTVDLVVGLL